LLDATAVLPEVSRTPPAIHRLMRSRSLSGSLSDFGGKFEGYGADAKFDDIFKIADPAARKLFESVGERVKIDISAGNSFGPIQAFILRKVG